MIRPRPLAAASAFAALVPLLIPGVAVAAAPVPPPPLAAPRPLQLPKIVERTLPNGLRLVILEDHRQPAVLMRLALPAGSIRDPQDKVGLAAMAASLLNKGTTSRTQEQIARTVDGLGANLGASADDDFLIVSASGLTPYADTLATLIADITLRPAFAPAEVNRYKTQAMAEIRSSLAQPATLANIAAARLVYGAHPYGNFSVGTPETLARITPDDLKTFHSTYFAPNAATLFVIGDLTAARAESIASKLFGSWKTKEIPDLPAPPASAEANASGKPRVTIIDRPGSAQTEVRIAALSSGFAAPERVAASVATAVLGVGQFEGRLTQEIRVKRGLTYGAGSTFDRKKQAGEFYISTFTKNASTGEVVNIALAEWNKLRTTPPPATELADRKTLLTGSFALSTAGLSSLASRLQTYTLLGGGPADLAKFIPRVQATTAQQVSQILADVPFDRAQIVLVGDAKAIQPQLTNFGPVTVISQDELDLLSPTLQGTPVPSPAAAATPATPEQIEAAKTLLDAVIAAHGGEAVFAVKSLKATGTGELTPPGSGSALPLDAVTMTTDAPDKVRLDMNAGFLGTITFASPGGGKLGWLSVAGSVQDPPVTFPGGDPTTLLRLAKQGNYTILPITEAAKPTSDGKALDGFTITDEKKRVTRIFAEKDSHLIRRIELKQGAVTVIGEMGNYQVTGGVQLPGLLMVSSNGQRILVANFKEYTLNRRLRPAFSSARKNNWGTIGLMYRCINGAPIFRGRKNNEECLVCGADRNLSGPGLPVN